MRAVTIKPSYQTIQSSNVKDLLAWHRVTKSSDDKTILRSNEILKAVTIKPS